MNLPLQTFLHDLSTELSLTRVAVEAIMRKPGYCLAESHEALAHVNEMEQIIATCFEWNQTPLEATK